MFDQLPESRRHHHRPLGAAALAMILHGAILGAALRHQPAPPPTPPSDTTVLVLPARQEAHSTPRATTDAVAPGFHPIVISPEIPRALPPVTLDEPPFDPRRFLTAVAPTSAIGGVGDSVDTTSTLNNLVPAAAADQPPVLISAGPRQLPPELDGIPGQVEARFVVDTTGRAEPASWRIVRSTNPAFEEPARAMIMRSTFRPGHLAGRAVRVQVQQVIAFRPE